MAPWSSPGARGRFTLRGEAAEASARFIRQKAREWARTLSEGTASCACCGHERRREAPVSSCAVRAAPRRVWAEMRAHGEGSRGEWTEGSEWHSTRSSYYSKRGGRNGRGRRGVWSPRPPRHNKHVVIRS